MADRTPTKFATVPIEKRTGVFALKSPDVTLIIKMLPGMQLANPAAPAAGDANVSAVFVLQLCMPVTVMTIK